MGESFEKRVREEIGEIIFVVLIMLGVCDLEEME
jgi:hypothetical protein